MEYLETTLTYPEIARSNGIEGTVHVTFMIGTDGKVISTGINRSAYSSLDSEATRVIKALPAFKPGTRNGTPQVTIFTQPVIFRSPYVKGKKIYLDSLAGQFYGNRSRKYDTFPYYMGNIQKDLYISDANLPKTKVNVLVTIDEEGKLRNPRALPGASADLQQIALAKVLGLVSDTANTKWKPAMKDNKPVACDMVLPVYFNEILIYKYKM